MNRSRSDPAPANTRLVNATNAECGISQQATPNPTPIAHGVSFRESKPNTMKRYGAEKNARDIARVSVLPDICAFGCINRTYRTAMHKKAERMPIVMPIHILRLLVWSAIFSILQLPAAHYLSARRTLKERN